MSGNAGQCFAGSFVLVRGMVAGWGVGPPGQMPDSPAHLGPMILVSCAQWQAGSGLGPWSRQAPVSERPRNLGQGSGRQPSLPRLCLPCDPG